MEDSDDDVPVFGRLRCGGGAGGRERGGGINSDVAGRAAAASGQAANVIPQGSPRAGSAHGEETDDEDKPLFPNKIPFNVGNRQAAAAVGSCSASQSPVLSPGALNAMERACGSSSLDHERHQLPMTEEPHQAPLTQVSPLGTPNGAPLADDLAASPLSPWVLDAPSMVEEETHRADLENISGGGGEPQHSEDDDQSTASATKSMGETQFIQVTRLSIDDMTGSPKTRRDMPMGTEGADDTQNEEQSTDDGCTRITKFAELLDRNECTILCLAGIKKSEVPNLQEQLRLLFRLVVDRGHRVALIDLQDTDIDIETFGTLMALIKAVRIRFAPPCLLQVIELRNKVLGESHLHMLSDLLWDRDVKRQSKLHKPLQLDLRGISLRPGLGDSLNSFGRTSKISILFDKFDESKSKSGIYLGFGLIRPESWDDATYPGSTFTREHRARLIQRWSKGSLAIELDMQCEVRREQEDAERRRRYEAESEREGFGRWPDVEDEEGSAASAAHPPAASAPAQSTGGLRKGAQGSTRGTEGSWRLGRFSELLVQVPLSKIQDCKRQEREQTKAEKRKSYGDNTKGVTNQAEAVASGRVDCIQCQHKRISSTLQDDLTLVIKAAYAEKSRITSMRFQGTFVDETNFNLIANFVERRRRAKQPVTLIGLAGSSLSLECGQQLLKLLDTLVNVDVGDEPLIFELSKGCFNEDLMTSIQQRAPPAKVQIRLLNT